MWMACAEDVWIWNMVRRMRSSQLPSDQWKCSKYCTLHRYFHVARNPCHVTNPRPIVARTYGMYCSDVCPPIGLQPMKRWFYRSQFAARNMTAIYFYEFENNCQCIDAICRRLDLWLPSPNHPSRQMIPNDDALDRERTKWMYGPCCECHRSNRDRPMPLTIPSCSPTNRCHSNRPKLFYPHLAVKTKKKMSSNLVDRGYLVLNTAIAYPSLHALANRSIHVSKSVTSDLIWSNSRFKLLNWVLAARAGHARLVTSEFILGKYASEIGSRSVTNGLTRSILLLNRSKLYRAITYEIEISSEI